MMTEETARLATIAHLAQILDRSPDAIAAALKRLEERGLIKVVAPDRTKR